ncbi:MAG: tetratricopeptide repeat-containing glycosyltransferase family 2 protein [Clostridium sp.]|uniref:tetratricopeptide repeat-containing glycosyltransferase family 2 protein n=1 Tax=Clostridium sp. TaxID=1506 RepID=UPI003F34E532
MIFIKTISLCVITRNNESTIEKCLSSVQSLVQEIIIVDTGSTDNTLAICEKFNANIFSIPWEDNFSKARNTALNLATKDFILVLDSDEFLPPETCTRIKKNLNERDCKAYSLLINNLNSNIPMNHGLTRLFINDKEIYFEHRIHEQIDWSFKRKYTEENSYCFTDMIIYHTGYDVSQDNSEKLKRNSKILNSYPDEEKDEYYYYLIGREQFFSKNYKLALENLSKAFVDSYKVEGQLKYIFLLKLACYNSLNMFDNTIKEGLRALKSDPKFKDVYYFLYVAYQNSNNPILAYQNLVGYKFTENNDIFYPTIVSISSTDLDLLILRYSTLYKPL